MSCDCDVQESDFNNFDDELNTSAPRCPGCQREKRIQGRTCEHCDDPAEYEVELGFLCEYHYSHYVDGYKLD